MAKELLADGKSSVTHTCMTCGFGNPSYFSRVFKEKTGLSPIKFKKQRGKVSRTEGTKHVIQVLPSALGKQFPKFIPE